jgi:hypothetical protein
MATYSDIFIDQGSTFSSVIDVPDTNGLPFNLSSYTARGQIRKTYTSKNVVTFTTSIDLPLEGKVNISLTAGQTRAMKAGRYLYDIEIFNSTGHIFRIREGQVEISPGISEDNGGIELIPDPPTIYEIIDERIDARTIVTDKLLTLSAFEETNFYANSKLNQNLALKAPLDSPVFTGIPIAPTASFNTNNQQIATTQFVRTAINNLIDGAPNVLDTLNELADAIGNDANFSTTIINGLSGKAPLNSPSFTGTVNGITKAMVGLGDVDNTSDANKPVSAATQTALNDKVDKVSGKGLSDENYTLVEKNKLDNIPAGVNYGIVTNAFPSGFGSGIAIINWQAGTYWSGYLGLVGGTQIQFQNVVAGKIITLSITGSGSAVSWPSGITWLGDSPPSLSVGGQTKIIRILATSTSTFVATVDTKLSSSANYSDLVNVPTTFPPSNHSHDIVGTQSYTAGFMSYSDKVKLDAIADGAEANVNADWIATTGDAQILNKPATFPPSSHTHTITDTTGLQTALDTKIDKVSGKVLSDENYTLVEKNKLTGIAYGATANSTDAHLLSRANHTGTQSHTTITGLGTLATQNGTFSGSSSGTNTGDQTITLEGDASGSGTDTINVTLTSTGVLAGEYNDNGSAVTPFTVDIKGRVTSIGTPISLSPDWNNITSTPTTLSGYSITDAVDTFSNQPINGIKEFEESPIVPLIPTASNRAVSKSYVDSIAEGLHIHESVHVIMNDLLETASGGSVAYSNGIDGIGAKLTLSGGSSVIATLNSACGTDPDLTYGANGSRVIINGQHSNPHWNGIYFISGEYELTRTLDFDTPLEMAGGDFVFVTHGTTYADTGWVLSEAVTQVGNSPVIFVQFSGAGAYDAGDGIVRDGTLFSVVAGNGITVNGNGVNLSAIGTPDTYKSVTIDVYGRVTSGTNPTTLAGYGITDAASDTQLNNHLNDSSNPHGVTAAQVSLGLVDNTSDLNKPISTATQNALNDKVDKITGQGLSDENYTLTEKNKLDGIAPGAEVNVNADWTATSGDAEILNKPTTFTPSSHTHAITDTTGLQTALDNKVDKVSGQGLSDQNYTLTEKNKLDGIASGAEVNVNADWTATSGDAQILNKPETFTPSSHTHAITDTTGLQTALDSKLNKVTTIDLTITSSGRSFANADDGKIFHINGTDQINVSLPNYSAVDDGWNIGIINTGGFVITINRVGIDNINGKSFVFNSTRYTAVYIYKSATANQFIALGVLY